MKTIEELETFIHQKAKEHAAAEDEWEYESIEINSFRAILRFFSNDGFTLEGIDYDILLDGYDEDSSKDPAKDQWFYFEKACETMDEMSTDGTLPPKVLHLYVFWRDTIWGQYYK